MPRTHGRIMASIWNDPDFVGLPPGPQRLYMFILSQPDLSHAGLVPLRVGRWAKKVAGGTRESIEAEIALLEHARFVLADYDTEELLVRTFVRNDGVYKQPKVMLRMREDARQIESAELRIAFRAELDRLPLDELAENTKVQVSGVVDALLDDFADVSAYPSEGVSDTHPDTPHVRAGAFPQPPSPIPQAPATVPATPGAAAAPPRELVIASRAEPTSQTLVAEWIHHCATKPPSRVIGHIAREVKQMLDDGIDYDQVRQGLAEWNGRDLHPSTLPSVVHGLGNRRPPMTGKQAAEEAMWGRAYARAATREGDS